MGKIVRHSQEELEKGARQKGAPDWAKVDALTDEEATSNALSDPDNRPLTDEELAAMKPAREVLPELLGEELAKELLKHRGRPKKQTRKQQITLRISPEVVEYFRSTGRGWQSRIDQTLQEAVKKKTTHAA
jgi:uncharacterized protein (DUF4415 family)